MDDDNKLQSYRKYKRFLQRLSVLSILWPPLVTRNTFYRTLGFINIFLLLKYSIFVLLFCIAHISQIAIFAAGIGLFLSFVFNFVKAWCYLTNRRELAAMKKVLDEMFEEEIQDKQTRSILLSNLGQFNYLCYVVSISVIITSVMYCAIPLSVVILEQVKNVEVKHYPLPLPAKRPYSIGNNMILYAIVFFFESSTAISIALITSSVDGLFGYFTFHISGQLKILSYRLRALECTGNVELYKSNIKRCIQKYLVVMECKNTLESVYGPVLLSLMATTALILCTVVFQAVEMELTLSKAILCTFYTTLKIMQAFTYTWYGSLLISESEKFYESIYFSDWPGSGSKAYVNDLLITISQKPFKITVCHFINLTVDVFKSILNTSVSYFCLLKAVNSQN